MANSVQHNITALNANRNFGITQATVAKSTEKLSSGYKINRAADDAAGLSISEKMRRQIKGLTQASSNAQDGISAVQTAEGALTEVHDMLQRMDELATKAANGSLSEDDRKNVQDEVDTLLTEIDRVSETTKFNETYLLKGNGNKSVKTVNAHDAGLAGSLVDDASDATKAVFTAKAFGVGDTVKIGGTDYTIVGSAKSSDYQSIAEYTAPAADDKLIQNGVTYSYDSAHTAWKDSNGNTTTLRAGDTLVTGGEKKTLVGATGLAMNVSPEATPSWAAGDTVTDSNGNTYTYQTESTTAGVNLTNPGFYTAQPGAAVAGTATPDYTLAGGETYTIAASGATGTVPSPSGIASIDSIKENIKGLAAGTVVQIGSNIDSTGTVNDYKSYTIGVTTKADGSVYTADDVADLVKAGNYVNNGTNTFYALPSAAEKDTEITVNEAYDKMASALEQASNIGTDSDANSKAVVKNNGDGTFEITKGSVTVDNALTFNLHVGADADLTNKIGVSIDTMNASGLGIKGLNVKDATGEAATYAIDAIEDAIKKVSTQRSALGATQNRLEHTIKNLDNVVENTTSAEQEIRDTDMATEMVKFSSANILSQAGTSMLAQANQSNQGILSLLG